MRKMLLIGALLCTTVYVKAQNSFGVQANGIFSTMDLNAQDLNGQVRKINTKGLISWKVGLVANVALTQSISFMPQLNILVKGTKIDDTQTQDYMGTTITYNIKGNSKLTYIELPLYFLYNPSEDEGFFGGVGPVLSYGLSGKTKGTITVNGSPQDQSADVKFDGKKDAQDNVQHFKAFEAGAGAIAGYKLASGLYFNVHYTLGLSNISPNTGEKAKNSYAGIGIGYFFGK